MPLSDVIPLFHEMGRVDITVSTSPSVYTYANAGQRYLDTHWPPPKSLAWYKKDTAAGDYKLEILYARAFKEVWITDSDGRTLLKEKSAGWLMDEYSDVMDDIDQDTPKYWAPLPIGLSPEQKALTSLNYTDDFTYDSEFLRFGDHFKYKGILWMPPADDVYTLSVLGDFASAPFTAEDDKTYWTEEYPEVLAMSMMLVLERFYRNFTGASNLKASIEDVMFGMTADMVSEEASHGSNYKEG